MGIPNCKIRHGDHISASIFVIKNRQACLNFVVASKLNTQFSDNFGQSMAVKRLQSIFWLVCKSVNYFRGEWWVHVPDNVDAANLGKRKLNIIKSPQKDERAASYFDH